MVRSPCPLNADDHLRDEAIAIAPVVAEGCDDSPHGCWNKMSFTSLHQSLLRSS